MIDIKIDVIGAEYPSLFLQVILPLTLENIPYRFSYDFNFQTDANILIIERGIPHRMSDYCYLTDVFNYCNQHNIKVIYALDDDMYTGDYGYSFKWMALSSMARWLSKHSDIVLATTNQIKEKALKYNKNVVVIENSLYPGFLNYQYKGNKTKLTIGYIGTKTHDKDLKLVVEVLKHLKQKYDFDVNFYGGFYTDNIYDFINYVDYKHNIKYPDYMANLIQSERFDIGIAPINFSRKSTLGKSHLKYIDYMLMGAVGIYTDCIPYQKYIRNNLNGLKVNNTFNDWAYTLELLITNENERSRMLSNAKQDILNNHLMNNKARQLREVIECLYKQ